MTSWHQAEGKESSTEGAKGCNITMVLDCSIKTLEAKRQWKQSLQVSEWKWFSTWNSMPRWVIKIKGTSKIKTFFSPEIQGFRNLCRIHFLIAPTKWGHISKTLASLDPGERRSNIRENLRGIPGWETSRQAGLESDPSRLKHKSTGFQKTGLQKRKLWDSLISLAL